MILEQVDMGTEDNEERFSILEIGCGTSTLVRDLKESLSRGIRKSKESLKTLSCTGCT